MRATAEKTPRYVRLGKIFREGGRARVAQFLNGNEISFELLKLPPDGKRWTIAVGKIGKLLQRLQKDFEPLLSLKPRIFQGLKTSADKIYLLNITKNRGSISECRTEQGERISIESGILRAVVRGENVRRYSIDRSANLHIIYPYEIDTEGRVGVLDAQTFAKRFPRAWDYLKRHKPILGARDRGMWGQRLDWYAYARSQNLGAFIGKKLLLPYMTTRLRTAPDLDGDLFFVNITTGGYGARFGESPHGLLYIAGLLNSRLLDSALRQLTNAFRGGYFAVNKQALERLPFRKINFSDRADKDRHDRMVSLVERMLMLHKQLAAAKTAHDRAAIQRQIDAGDAQIDQLVYQLYELTPDEIKIVEAATA